MQSFYRWRTDHWFKTRLVFKTQFPQEQRRMSLSIASKSYSIIDAHCTSMQSNLPFASSWLFEQGISVFTGMESYKREGLLQLTTNCFQLCHKLKKCSIHDTTVLPVYGKHVNLNKYINLSTPLNHSIHHYRNRCTDYNCKSIRLHHQQWNRQRTETSRQAPVHEGLLSHCRQTSRTFQATLNRELDVECIILMTLLTCTSLFYYKSHRCLESVELQ